MWRVQVPLVREASENLRTVPSEVWEWNGLAQDQGDEVATWLTSYLGKPARLQRYMGVSGGEGASVDPKRRVTDVEFAPDNEVAFADGFPYLLISQESLADINAHLEEAIPMTRFRPNLVTVGGEPWAEDAWEAFKIVGDGRPALEFSGVKPCSRCKVTTIDQLTAKVGKEPLKAMNSFRSGKVLGWAGYSTSWGPLPPGKKRGKWSNDVFCGINMVGRQDSGIVAVGDKINVLQVREGCNEPAAEKVGASIADPSDSTLSRYLFWIILTPVVASMAFMYIRGRMS